MGGLAGQVDFDFPGLIAAEQRPSPEIRQHEVALNEIVASPGKDE